MVIRRFLFSVCLAVVLAMPAQAQDSAAPADAADVDDQPTELGIRFTPGMARGMAKAFTREVLVHHYEMDESKSQETVELLTRRLMKVAHANEEKGQETIEWLTTEWVRYVANKPDAEQFGMPQVIGQGLGQRMLPFMPVVREFVDGAVTDIRPMLGVKGQLKLAGELTVFKMGMDAFEKNMEQWSKGDVDPTGNPFDTEDSREIKKDAEGVSQQLKSARQSADMQSKQAPGDEWNYYVEEAKKYYQFDPSQSVTADSLLRDYKQRAAVAVGDDKEWKARLYRNRLWWMLSWQLPGKWENPVRTFVQRDYDRLREPLEALGDELKRRVDEVATQGQREAAEQRMHAAMAEKGFDVSKIAVSPAPAASTVEAHP